MSRVFVGRCDELAVLQEMAAAAAAGVGGAVLVEGEQGIGKTALLRAGLGGAQEAGCRLAWAAADELGQRFPLQLIRECLGTEGRFINAAGATGVATEAIPFAGDPVLAGVERVLSLVDRLCTQSPLVLVAEDLQWADEASVLVWHRLSAAVRQLPLLLAASCRTGPVRTDVAQLRRGLVARGGRVVTLGPLPRREVSDLVAKVVGASSGERLQRLVGRAGGNPLYARELADAVLREGRVRVESGVAELVGEPGRVGVPVSLTAAISERLGSLPDQTISVLRWAAVLGQEFSVTDLEVVTGLTAGELMGAVQESVTAGVVNEAGPRLAFRHGLIRQSLYEGMPVALRAALHRRAARALADAGAPPERVAAQLVALPEPADTWLLDWLTSAAPVLAYRAPRIAADLLQTSISQLADTDPRREPLEVSQATVACLLGRTEEVEQVGMRLLRRTKETAQSERPGPDHPGDADRAAEVAWLVAYARMHAGQAHGALAAVDEALARQDVSERYSARLHALRALALTDLYRLDESVDASNQALAGAERTGDRFAAGYAHHTLSVVNCRREDPAGNLQHINLGLAVIGDDPQLTDLRLLLLTNSIDVLLDLDRQEEALATTLEAQVLAERAGTQRVSAISTRAAECYFEVGRWDDALAELEPPASLPHNRYSRIRLHGLSALIAGHRDDTDTALEHLRVATDMLRHDDALLAHAPHVFSARAVAAERADRPGEAAAVLAELLQPQIAKKMPLRSLLLPTLVRLAVDTGDTATATAAAHAAAAEAQRQPPLPARTAAADHCRGLLDADPAPLLETAAYYQAISRPLLRAQVLEDAAALLAARGDTAAARQSLTEACGLYRELGAEWDIRRADTRLRAHGVRRGRTGQARKPAQGWDSLTPTETKIAYLVAQGRSNPDIAAALFLSRNTVQTHVSHILTKLSARSRAEIIREALHHPAPGQRAS